MESNAMTWNEVAASIIDDDRGKWDRKLPAASLSIGQNGQLVTMNGGPAPEPYVLLELATRQLCERLGIPAPCQAQPSKNRRRLTRKTSSRYGILTIRPSSPDRLRCPSQPPQNDPQGCRSDP